MIFRRTYVTFESDAPIAESVRRLASATQASSGVSGKRLLRASYEHAAFGRVDERAVQLIHATPNVHNSFATQFRGRFEEGTNGRAVLNGSFGMARFTVVFLCIWFGMLSAFMVLIATLILMGKAERGATTGLLICCGMAIAAVGVVGFGRHLARNDEAWLSEFIRNSLAREPAK